MSDTKRIERREIFCHEEQRNAELMVEWADSDGESKVVSVQCDNPKFPDLRPYDCCWSCWERIEKETKGGDLP